MNFKKIKNRFSVATVKFVYTQLTIIFEEIIFYQKLYFANNISFPGVLTETSTFFSVNM